MHEQDGKPSDADLVRAARKGDLSAFDALVARHQRKATAVAYRLLNHREDALEVTQDALLKAFDKLNTLSKPARFSAWLMRIVSNLALNKRRSRALRYTASLDVQAENDEGRGEMNRPDPRVARPDQNVSAGDVQAIIDRTLENLPDMQRQALLLFTMEKLPQKEIAELLQCSVEAVKWHVFSARKKLKEALQDYL
ncbi:MAG: RNA polymerase sigma factor [Phycisphaerae bacterium]